MTTSRAVSLSALSCAAAVATASPARADGAPELPTIGQTAVSTTAESRLEGTADLGLDLLWLPLEARANVADSIGRNVPGATLDNGGRLLLRGGRPTDTAGPSLETRSSPARANKKLAASPA